MYITQTLSNWLTEREFSENVVFHQVSTPRQAVFEPFPVEIQPALQQALNLRGITALYSHQAEAFRHVQNGENLVISTGTSSGKSLCYSIPILNQQIVQPCATALLLFPTKALTNDQHKFFADIGALLPGDKFKPAVYDGDTPSHQRSPIRKSATILMTNPDMLHQGILPHHTNWARFFSNLRYVVIDEMHIYRGVFGSHFANVLRRLKRICAFYNSYPQFILTSATIGNPVELAAALVEQKVHLIEQDGSPKGLAHFILYNPPFVDEKLGIRKSSIDFGVIFSQKLINA